MNGIPIKINSKKIEKIRKRLLFTQENIAEKIGLKHRSYLVNLERGTMKPKHIKVLLDVFNRRTEQLRKLLKEIREDDIT